MSWLLKCICGVELSGLTEDALLLAAEGHITTEHPALGVPPARADLLAMAEEVEDEG